MIQSNKKCNAQWEGNLHQYAHHAEPLFEVFTSKEALRWALFVRNMDARGWEFQLFWEGMEFEHNESFDVVSIDGDLDIMKVMVERTQVDLEGARDDNDKKYTTDLCSREGSPPCGAVLM